MSCSEFPESRCDLIVDTAVVDYTHSVLQRQCRQVNELCIAESVRKSKIVPHHFCKANLSSQMRISFLLMFEYLAAGSDFFVAMVLGSHSGGGSFPLFPLRLQADVLLYRRCI